MNQSNRLSNAVLRLSESPFSGCPSPAVYGGRSTSPVNKPTVPSPDVSPPVTQWLHGSAFFPIPLVFQCDPLLPWGDTPRKRKSESDKRTHFKAPLQSRSKHASPSRLLRRTEPPTEVGGRSRKSLTQWRGCPVQVSCLQRTERRRNAAALHPLRPSRLCGAICGQLPKH